MTELLFKLWCRQEYISAEDFEEMEEWDEYERIVKNLINNLLTMPVRDAFALAQQEGWIWKRYRELVMIVAGYENNC